MAEHRLAKSFDYHKTPAPFIQVWFYSFFRCHSSTESCQIEAPNTTMVWRVPDYAFEDPGASGGG